MKNNNSVDQKRLKKDIIAIRKNKTKQNKADEQIQSVITGGWEGLAAGMTTTIGGF